MLKLPGQAARCIAGEMIMMPVRTRREFIKRLLALPLLGARAVASAMVREYDLNAFPVAGFAYHEGPRLLGRLCQGLPLRLVSEPGNLHDARAVRIEAFGRHIGYVPRSDNGPLDRLLVQGAPVAARVLAVEPGAPAWSAVTVAVSLRLGGVKA